MGKEKVKAVQPGPADVKFVPPGRNEPCHCGSGKKYKNCHLIQDEEKRAHLQKETMALSKSLENEKSEETGVPKKAAIIKTAPPTPARGKVFNTNRFIRKTSKG